VPWNISWTTKVRYKSTTGVMLGMPSMGGAGAMSRQDDADDAPGQHRSAAEPKKKKGGLFGKLKDAAEGAIPH